MAPPAGSQRVGGPTPASGARARWSLQPLFEAKELIGHYADRQQHQQRHDDGGTHSSIVPDVQKTRTHLLVMSVSYRVMMIDILKQAQQENQ